MPVTSRHKRLDWACLGSVTAVLAHSVPALAVPAPVASKPAAQARFPAKPPTGPFAERTAKLIAEGRAALEAKDFPKAQRSFEQAYWFRSTPDLLYLLGQVADAQGQNVTALDFFRRYLESGSQSTDEATTEALRKRIQEVPATSSEVTISGHGGGLLSVDGRLLGVLPLHRALLLTPGPHRFKIEWKGAHFESDPLLIPESRTAELHLTPGTAGSLIAVLTLNSFAVLKLSSTDLPPEQHKTVEESITTAARNEHTVFLPDAKLRELLQAEPQGCLDDTPCLDRIASKAEIRYVVRVALSGQQSAPTVAAAAELVDVASGLAAGRIEENLPRDSLGPQTVALIRRLFQTALGRPRGMLHIESTISRVTTAKYMATPFGTFELKYFFGSSLNTDAGGNASSTAVRALIKQLVAAEDANKPLSDSQISQMLEEQGIQVARRTVAKYREALKIAPANLRKAM